MWTICSTFKKNDTVNRDHLVWLQMSLLLRNPFINAIYHGCHKFMIVLEELEHATPTMLRDLGGICHFHLRLANDLVTNYIPSRCLHTNVHTLHHFYIFNFEIMVNHK